MSSRWALFLLLLIAGPLTAESPGPVLTARPGLCIIKDSATVDCVMALELTWNAADNAPFCLHHSEEPEALRCWDFARQGRHHIELSSIEDISYWLQSGPQEQHLAEITVRIVRLAQRNPERRRRRHVWSLL